MAEVPVRTVTSWKVHHGLMGSLSIRFACPQCGSKLTSPAADVGKADNCPECKCLFGLPPAAAIEVLAIHNAKESERLAKQHTKQQAQEAKERQRRADAEVEAQAKARQVPEEAASTVSVVSSQAAQHNEDAPSNLELGGLILLVIGLLIGFVSFGLDVSSGGKDIVNINQLQIRQNTLLVGCFVSLFGVIYSAAGVVTRKLADNATKVAEGKPTT